MESGAINVKMRVLKMRFAKSFFLACFLLVGFAAVAQASVVVRIDKSEQMMHVYIDGQLAYVWPVSTGRWGYNTPVGSYRPYVLRRYHRSSKYDDAPMPYSIFFRGGYAIHGTTAVRRLGSPASHGCIRLHMSNARELYNLISSYGKYDTRILIRP
jgi:lipoprotein-anchoring transpeptidase ErfK/SrfK